MSRSGKAVLVTVACGVVAFVAWGLLDYAYLFWRTYEGYCATTGQRIATTERFRIALDHYLDNQGRLALYEIGKVERPDNPGPARLEEEFTVDRYANREAFLARNPDCCQLTWTLPEGGRIGAWEKADGSGDGYFYFNYRIRYAGHDGVAKEIVATRTYYQVTNCGQPRSKVF